MNKTLPKIKCLFCGATNSTAQLEKYYRCPTCWEWNYNPCPHMYDSLGLILCDKTEGDKCAKCPDKDNG